MRTSFQQWDLVGHDGKSYLVQAAYGLALPFERERYPDSKKLINLCTPDFRSGPVAVPDEQIEHLPWNTLSEEIRKQLKALGITETL